MQNIALRIKASMQIKATLSSQQFGEDFSLTNRDYQYISDRLGYMTVKLTPRGRKAFVEQMSFMGGKPKRQKFQGHDALLWEGVEGPSQRFYLHVDGGVTYVTTNAY